MVRPDAWLETCPLPMAARLASVSLTGLLLSPPTWVAAYAPPETARDRAAASPPARYIMGATDVLAAP